MAWGKKEIRERDVKTRFEQLVIQRPAGAH